MNNLSLLRVPSFYKSDMKCNLSGNLESGPMPRRGLWARVRQRRRAVRGRPSARALASAPTNAKITRAPSVLVIVILVSLDPTSPLVTVNTAFLVTVITAHLALRASRRSKTRPLLGIAELPINHITTTRAAPPPSACRGARGPTRRSSGPAPRRPAAR